jgi:hypothetical protein
MRIRIQLITVMRIRINNTGTGTVTFRQNVDREVFNAALVLIEIIVVMCSLRQYYPIILFAYQTPHGRHLIYISKIVFGKRVFIHHGVPCISNFCQFRKSEGN